MSKKALLINYEYCSGCRSCELACRNEHNIPEGCWGIRVKDEEPWQLPDGTWHWDYVPVPTSMCDACEGRLKDGLEPMCVQSCQAKVIEIGVSEELLARTAELSGKIAIFQT
jgi:Fe-S-cluster-containing dehydrogenase component